MQISDLKKEISSQEGDNEYIVRPRINTLLAKSVNNPLTVVCAGMGSGKTRAVYDFLQEYKMPVVWLQLSDADNVSTRFWKGFLNALVQVHGIPFVEKAKRIGFPDTEDKINMFLTIRNRNVTNKRYVLVFDDLYVINNPDVLHFIERIVYDSPENRSVILISRKQPQINISGFMVRDKVSMINESELNFTESEIGQFLLQEGLDSETKDLNLIYADTRGWAFNVNFVVRILKRSPGYAGYARNAIKQDIFQLIEIDVWDSLAPGFKNFLLRLSLIEFHSSELVAVLSEGSEDLINDLNQLNDFIRFDKYMDSYYIQHLFLQFLCSKQDRLTDDEVRKTYSDAAAWCVRNNFIIDALLYYEKTEDYESIVNILFSCSIQFFINNKEHLLKIFENAPEEVFDSVQYSAAMYLLTVYCTFEWQKAVDLAERLEEKYMKLPENSEFRNRMLGLIYHYWGVTRMALATVDDHYDFDRYFEKQYNCLKDYKVAPACMYHHAPGLWTTLTGSERAGASQEFFEALTRSAYFMQNCTNGLTSGIEDLCQGELYFYHGDINYTENLFNKALTKAWEYKQYEIIHRSLFYLMRVAVCQGDEEKLDNALAEMEKLLDYSDYFVRTNVYDISIGWYYYVLNKPERVPSWLKERFVDNVLTNSLENSGNHIRARYYYMTKNYAGLLAYMDGQRRHSSILYERLELLTMEACIHHKMKNEEQMFRVMQEAYDAARPNGIVIPFIELGNDMRMLIEAIEKEPARHSIDNAWLKNIKQRAANYYKNQSFIISNYKRTNELGSKIVLSKRENEILHDLAEGLSRSEIAEKYDLSINTVKYHITGIYDKLGARNRSDIFRISAEYDLL